MELKLENEIVSYVFVTANAITKIKELIEEESKTAEKPIGIRLYLKPKGCSGMKKSAPDSSSKILMKKEGADAVKVFTSKSCT